jgi:hypothetical protein
MNYKKHKNVTILLGGFLLASLLLNLIQIFLFNPKSFSNMFRLPEEMGMPWISYISLAVIFFSALGAIGLMKYRQWGFYAIYLTYLAGASVAYFPFFPGFIFQFAPGIYRGIITLILIFAILAFLIYLHVAAKKRLYFKKVARHE